MGHGANRENSPECPVINVSLFVATGVTFTKKRVNHFTVKEKKSQRENQSTRERQQNVSQVKKKKKTHRKICLQMGQYEADNISQLIDRLFYVIVN